MDKNGLYIVCKNCGHYEEVNSRLFAKIIGGAVAGFGYWAWVSFLFAGTGLAMPICIAIMAGGVAIIAFAEQIVGWINKMYACPKCGRKVWVTAKYNEIQQEEIIRKQEVIIKECNILIQELEKNANNERLNVEGLKKEFHKAFEIAKKEIDIYVPKLGYYVFETEMFKRELYEALNRGCIIKIRCGNIDETDYNGRTKLGARIETFVLDKRFADFYKNGKLRFQLDDSHAKLLLVDNDYYIISSMNFLSNPGEDMLYNGKVRQRWEELGEKSQNRTNLLAYRGEFFSF